MGARPARNPATVIVDEAFRGARADHELLPTPRPPWRSSRSGSARRTTSSISASRRRRRRPADRATVDDPVNPCPDRWSRMHPAQSPPVERQGRAAGSILDSVVVRSRSAPVRCGTWQRSVPRFASPTSVRLTGSTPHEGEVAGSGATKRAAEPPCCPHCSPASAEARSRGTSLSASRFHEVRSPDSSPVCQAPMRHEASPPDADQRWGTFCAGAAREGGRRRPASAYEPDPATSHEALTAVLENPGSPSTCCAGTHPERLLRR